MPTTLLDFVPKNQPARRVFPTNVWGGKTNSFTVPSGVSELKLTAVATGGGSGYNAGQTTSAMNGTGNNVIFARLNGVDPAFVSFAQQEATKGTFALGFAGKYASGSVVNYDSNQSINGANDMSIGAALGRMSGSYFNALDAIPWGIVVSSSSGGNNRLSTTIDGFNFTHTTITTSAPIVYSCVFGAAGQAMVAVGATANSNLYYTSNYGETWTNLVGGVTTAVTRLRYLNGYWIAIIGGTTFNYIATPVTSAGVVSAWSTSTTLVAGIADIAWTGSVGVVTYANATNVQISAWASGAAPSGTWTTQAHGGDLAFDACENSPAGEVMLYKRNTATTSATSIRATSGAATTYNSVNLYGSTTSEKVCFENLKYLPFTSGAMWAMVGGTSAFVYTTTSAITPTLTKLAIAAASTGNTFANAVAINNLQYLGANYCSLGSTNGLGKYASAGVITASLNSAAQLSTEFGYVPTNIASPPVRVKKNGVEILKLLGGGTVGVGSYGVSAGGIGGGSLNQATPGPGIGPCGAGTWSSATLIVQKDGTAGMVTVLGASLYAGGGTFQTSGPYQAAPGSILLGAGGASGGAGYAHGGGGSLFSPGGSVSTSAVATATAPLTAMGQASSIGSYGKGNNGTTIVHASSYVGGGGGGQGCFQWPITVTAGDVITLEMPGCSGYIFYDGSTNMYLGMGGESFAFIEYQA